jgi:hypothetical protein
MIDSNTPDLLRNIPIQIVVDGVEITGEILFARFNDMSVVIRSPVSGLGTGLHVPWFRYGYPQFALATRDALTDRGRREAKWMLKELYDYSRDDDRDGAFLAWTRSGDGAKSLAIFESWTRYAWRIHGV